MAVFSKISHSELEDFLKNYKLGNLLGFEGIQAGIENTNYFIFMSSGKYVLTIFEKLSLNEAQFYLEFMLFLSSRKTLCPMPIISTSDQVIRIFKGKPATLVTALEGITIEKPTSENCYQVGQALAQTHLDSTEFHNVKPNCRGFEWCKTTSSQILRFMSEKQKKLLASEIEKQTAFRESSLFKILPTAMVHGDLFKDNVLFRENFAQKKTGDNRKSAKKYQLTGLIDFYFAGTDVLCYDLAVTLNDWAISTNDETFGNFKKNYFDKMISGYESIRQLVPEERRALPMMLRGAALRFWISRLFDWHQPREASLLSPKNPEQFEIILKKRRGEINYGNE